MPEGQGALNNKFGRVESDLSAAVTCSEPELGRALSQDQSGARVFDHTKCLGLKETTATQLGAPPNHTEGRWREKPVATAPCGAQEEARRPGAGRGRGSPLGAGHFSC